MACISTCLKGLLLALALTAGAATHAQKVQIHRTPAPVAFEEMPQDIAAVTMTLIAIMRGLPEAELPAEVRLEPGSTAKLADPYTRFEGFDLRGVRFDYIGPSRKGGPGRRLVGTFSFSDETGRSAHQTFAVDYGLGRDGVVIHEAASDRAPPLVPRVVLLAVPVRQVPPDLLQTARPHGELLGWLADHAIDPKRPYEGERGFYVFAVSLDRLGPKDRLVFEPRQPPPQKLLDQGGWVVAVRHIDTAAAGNKVSVGYRPATHDWTIEELATFTLPVTAGGATRTQ